MVWHLLTSDHVLKFVFETITDVSFLPGLVVLGRRGRHFECYVGLAQFITSFFYNLCDALDVSVFLPALQWHMLNNIFSITLGCFTLIYLMGNRNELRDHVLRYTVFSAVWVFQVKDEFWMEQSQYTVSVPVACAILLLFRMVTRTPPYSIAKVPLTSFISRPPHGTGLYHLFSTITT
eukprot:m.212679 g.212679  ORF g.212679 m.212679 type:complete len:178 (-) comp19049_c0_seq7:215-748(-)